MLASSLLAVALVLPSPMAGATPRLLTATLVSPVAAGGGADDAGGEEWWTHFGLVAGGTAGLVGGLLTYGFLLPRGLAMFVVSALVGVMVGLTAGRWLGIAAGRGA